MLRRPAKALGLDTIREPKCGPNDGNYGRRLPVRKPALSADPTPARPAPSVSLLSRGWNYVPPDPPADLGVRLGRWRRVSHWWAFTARELETILDPRPRNW